MDWQVIVVLLLVIPLILIPVLLIWYLNIGGLYLAIKEGKFKTLESILKKVRIGIQVMVPVGIYALLIWFFYGHFGWPVALATAVVLPIVLFIPVMIWAIVVSGLYQVVRETMRRRAYANRRRTRAITGELAMQEVTRERQ